MGWQVGQWGVPDEYFGDYFDDLKLNTSRFDPQQIRYSQAGYSEQGNGYTVSGNTEWLKANPGQDLPTKPIRIFVKDPIMNDWGPKTNKGYTGDSVNLLDGKIYTLDHRRLVAYNNAGRSSIPVEWVTDLRFLRTQVYKFSTQNYGTNIIQNP